MSLAAPSSDDESEADDTSSDEEVPPPPPPSVHNRTLRNRAPSQDASQAVLPIGARRRAATNAQTNYHESSEDEESTPEVAQGRTRSSSRLAPVHQEQSALSPRRRPQTPRTAPFPKSKANTHNKSTRSPTRKLAHRSKGDTSLSPAWDESKVIPAWEKLEWSYLVQIFEYASHPLDNKASLRWLLSAGLTCKAFYGATMKALYRNPPPLPIISMSMAHKFTHLLRQLAADPETALAREDHRRTMIESLVIDVSALTSTVYQGHSLDVAELIQFVPKLSQLELYHSYDLPPYRKLDVKKKKWLYSAALLEALRLVGESEPGTRLKAWKWSERMMDNVLPPEGLKAVHEYKTFSRLQKISFVNFQVPSLRENKDPTDPVVFEEDKAYISTIAESLAPLLGLKHLVMESSTVVDGQFLSLLPKTIQHLEIVNCWELEAENLSQYLETHGHMLRRLTLHHNQSLSLAFLPKLRCCPNLRELRMDLTYYNHHEYYNDSTPIYDTLLTVHDIPIWPETMQVIDLEQLNIKTSDVAEMLLQSFVDSAPRMAMLRHLGIKAMLDVPWRERSSFRDKWVSKLKKVFLRKTTPPRPFHSLSQWPLLKAQENESLEQPPKEGHDDAQDEEVHARRSTRIASTNVAAVDPPSPATSESVDDRKRKRTGSMLRDLRQPKRAAISYKDPDTDEDLDELEESEAETENPSLTTPPNSPPADDDDVSFVHGMCDVVNIRFDNQKPREFQWSAEDFLDSEEVASEDDDWNSDREREADGDSDGYAW